MERWIEGLYRCFIKHRAKVQFLRVRHVDGPYPEITYGTGKLGTEATVQELINYRKNLVDLR